MRALLTTRCGCQRFVQTTFPAPPEIIVPLDIQPRTFSDRQAYPRPDMERPEAGIPTRRFRLDSPPWGDDEKGEASYVEVYP